MAATTLTKNIRKLEIPKALADRSNGFAIDIGGSVVKLVYLSKHKWGEEKADQDEDASSDTTTLYMTSCAKDNMDDAIEFIKNNVHIRRPVSGEPPAIYTTGVGSNQMTERFIKEFNIKIINTMEFDSFVRATDFLLKNSPASDVFTDFPADSFRAGIKQSTITTASIEPWMNMAEHTKFLMDRQKFAAVKDYLESMNQKLDSGESGENNAPHQYPYILGQLGSGFVYLKVYEDLSCRMLDLTPFAGRSFIDLGRLLTGAKTYEELIALAEEGCEDRLNIRMCDSVTAVEGDMYSTAQEDATVIYSFGKAHGKDLDEVNKADLACTLLHEICANVLKIAVYVMTRENCRDVYLAGSFVGSPITQHILTKKFEMQRAECFELSTAEISMADLRMRIIREGGILGALGTFLTGCD